MGDLEEIVPALLFFGFTTAYGIELLKASPVTSSEAMRNFGWLAKIIFAGIVLLGVPFAIELNSRTNFMGVVASLLAGGVVFGPVCNNLVRRVSPFDRSDIMRIGVYASGVALSVFMFMR